MSLFTTIWNLLKKNPATDGNEMFNIQTMLNDNWDKIDSALGMKAVNADVRAATIANITLSGLQTVDGVALAVGDRVLVKNQATGNENGIYVASSNAWTRSADADTSAKLAAGIFVQVKEGSANAGTGWVLSNPGAITLGTTALTFVQKTGTGSATDAVIGTRAIDDTVAAASGSDTPTRLWSKLAYMIKAITGKSNWYTPPATTIEALNANKLNASAYTAADVLAKITTVDGPGSGLDADTVDGKHASDLVAVTGGNMTGELLMDHQIRMDSITDGASQWSRPIYFNTTNASAVKTTNNYLQVDNANDLRYVKAGGVSQIVWHAGNDGPGSGLDADTVDGLQASTSATGNTVVARDANGTIVGYTLQSTAGGSQKPLYINSQILVDNLNADLLDGKHLSDLLLQPINLNTSGTDLNTITTPGMYYCPSNATAATHLNSPTTNAYSLLVEKHAGFKQTLTEYMTSNSKTWIRNYYSGSWGAWRRLWDDQTDGAGSGMDADTVDGLSPTVSVTKPSIVARDSNGDTRVNTLYADAPQGQAPLGVVSTTLVSNLNADMVDGYHLDQDLRKAASPEFSNVTLNGGSYSLHRPSPSSGSWARGLDITLNGNPREAMFGVYGSGPTFQHAFMATGDNPWLSGSGIYILPNGNVGVKKINPNSPLDVNGEASATSFKSTAATGTAPFTVASTTAVTNLNADMVDGKHASDFAGKAASVSEFNVSAADTSTTALSYVTTAAGNYQVLVYLRVTATTTVTLWVTYTDVSGAQQTNLVTNQSFTAGSYSLLPLFINNTSGTGINVRISCSNANTVKVSASIVGV